VTEGPATIALLRRVDIYGKAGSQHGERYQQQAKITTQALQPSTLILLE